MGGPHHSQWEVDGIGSQIGCGLQVHVAANPSLPFVMKATWNDAFPLEILDGQLESCGYYSYPLVMSK